jgi:hypothetical protein
LSRLTSIRTFRVLAAWLSLLTMTLGAPSGGAFALCLGNDGHLAIEAVTGGGHDLRAADGVQDVRSPHHIEAPADCLDIPLVQAVPLAAQKSGATAAAPDFALPASPPAWPRPAARPALAAAIPAERPALDPRLVAHRTVVLLN